MKFECTQCSSDQLANVGAKCSDLCSFETVWDQYESDGYVPDGVGIGGGDYVEFTYCLNCGQIQGTFPVTAPLTCTVKTVRGRKPDLDYPEDYHPDEFYDEDLKMLEEQYPAFHKEMMANVIPEPPHPLAHIPEEYRAWYRMGRSAGAVHMFIHLMDDEVEPLWCEPDDDIGRVEQLLCISGHVIAQFPIDG